jgi:sugar O-acyltransferase (sialic acid O-acetyltransferase NeuD family)
VAILGAGGLAREVLWLLDELEASGQDYTALGFVDEDPARHGSSLCERPVLGGMDWVAKHAGSPDIAFVSAIGSPVARRKVVEQAATHGARFVSLCDPRVRMSRFVELGEGSVVTAGCILTTQVRVGSHVFLNLDCTVGHDAVIGDWANVNPGVHVSGNVTLGEGCNIGTGAAIIQGKMVGPWTIVGAGAVVRSDLPAGVTAVGVPAKVIKEQGLPA